MDDTAVPDAGATGRRRRFGAFGQRPMGALAVLALLAVALAATGGVGGRTGTPSGRIVEPEAVTLVAGGDSHPGAPPPIEEPRASRYEEVLGMAVRGRTVVAVGRRAPQPRNERLDLVEPLAWWSTDQGETWHGASVPGKGGLRAVAAVQAGFVAVGEIVEAAGSRAVVLASDDGRTWTEESVAGLTGVVFDTIAVTPRGPILAGYRVGTEWIEPFALIRSAPAGWRPAVLPGRIANGHAQIRGGCVGGDDVVLVGRVIGDDGTRTPLIVRSSDRGETWVTVQLPGAAIAGPDSLANGCAFVSGRLAVVGETLLEDGDGRAFVSLETMDGWTEPDLLEPSDTRPGHSVATRVVSMGTDLAVVGEMTLGESGRDLAVWYGAPGRWVRLDALEELGSGAGAGFASHVVAIDGVVLVGGTTSDRAVVWRSSPGRAQRPPEPTTIPVPPPRGSGDAEVVSGDPVGEAWLAAHAGIDPCQLADVALLRTVMGAEPVVSPVGTSPGVVIECRWLPPDSNRFVSLQIAQAHRLDAFEAANPSEALSRSPMSGICEDARYYGRVQAAMARCGDMIVAISGLPQEQATVLLRAVSERLPA
jgi:hypothetical protein